MSLVLVVDDEFFLRDILASMIDQLGLDAKQASNGAEAVNLVVSQPIDLVFMDYNMPTMNGIEAARCIHAANPLLPIVMLSANRDELVNMDSIDDAGIVAFLGKPFDFETIEAVVKRFCPSAERRRHSRVNLMPGQMSASWVGEGLKADLLDISPTGARMRLPQLPSPDPQYNVLFSSQTEDGLVEETRKVRVVWSFESQQMDDASHYTIGCRFVPQKRERLVEDAFTQEIHTPNLN